MLLFKIYLFYLLFNICCSSSFFNISNVNNGKRYDGIGAISGGGATSKLLVNYPAKEQGEVLDYLFKPHFGASLQMLKVEIGGDDQSTEGTESSHMHESWDENYNRGYEWWLMKEAKKRNPDIRLYGLPWAFPGWVGGGEWWPFKDPSRPAMYVTKWIMGAKKYHGLDIDFIGLWNEKPYDIDYVKVLRQTLNAHNLTHVRIVAADMINEPSWDIVTDMAKDKQFNDSIDIVGGHYTGTWTSEAAKHCGKPLCASEDYGCVNDETGGGCMARLINQNYVNGLMTSTIAWNMLTAYLDGLPSNHHSLMTAQQPWSGFYEVSSPIWASAWNMLAAYYDGLDIDRHGLMTAQQPWSGFYEVKPPIWATAHTTQFTEIGWRYAAHGSGVGALPKGGTYVTLISPDQWNFTIVIETMDTVDADFCLRVPQSAQRVQPQNVTFTLQGSLSKVKSLHLWETHLGLGKIESSYFIYKGSAHVRQGQVTLHLEKNSIYTLTTVSTGHKGFYKQVANSQSFPLPYQDNFDSYDLEQEAFNLANQVGVFEVKMAATGGEHKQVLRQVLMQNPVFWCPLPQVWPITLIGNKSWSDVSVSLDVYVGSDNATRGVHLGIRVNNAGCWTFGARGVFVFLNYNTYTFQICTDLAATEIKHTGSIGLDRQKWYTLTLSAKGDQVKVTLNNNTLFDATLPNQPSHQGFVGFGTTNFGLAEFDDLVIH